jgi:hypothetical protein
MVKKLIIQQSFYIFKESLISAISSGVNSSKHAEYSGVLPARPNKAFTAP